jgi:ligand-binding sensor domain-containing protein
MKRKNRVILILGNAVILALMFSFIACEDTPGDILDPDTAGVWTLITTVNGLPSNQIIDIERDAENNLWIAFSGMGVGKVRDGRWTFYRTANSSLLSDNVTSLAATPDGGMIIGTTNGIAAVTSTGIWSSYKDPTVTTMSINTVAVTSDGTRWVGTETEGYYVDDGSGYDQVLLAPFVNVNAITEDNKGIVYLGTDNALLQYTGTLTRIITTAAGLPANNISSLFFDSKERLWVGTDGGKTVAWSDDGLTFNQLSLMNGGSGTSVKTIYEDRRGHIWFGTSSDGLIEYDGVIPHSYKIYNGFFEDNVTCMGEDGSGNIWIGLATKGLVRYTLPIE